MASTMKICSECRRHLMAPEPQCPFCGAAMPMEAAPTVRRRCQEVMLGLSMALGSVGCIPDTDDPTDPGPSDPTTFNIPFSATGIPSLSTWGLLLLAGSLGWVGLRFLARP